VERFGDAVAVLEQCTETRTGWFEVEVVGGEVLHSKKNGDEHVHDEATLQRILTGVATHLETVTGRDAS